jgi:hypothetical protein
VRVLVAGWFSFEEMGATAGDILARDLVCDWLDAAGIAYDVALAPPFTGGLDWQGVDPASYSHVVFVCGPFGNGWPITDFLARFERCRIFGLNVSMLESLETWNPFDLLLERDSSVRARPDISFLSGQAKIPVVGLVLIHPQLEYGARSLQEQANDALRELVAVREVAVVEVDTRLDANSTGLRTAAEVESLIARMDVVLTTRLHGLVLALKNGVPALAVDPVAGGAKISRQAHAIGWPLSFIVDVVCAQELERAFEHCLTEEARLEARQCAERTARELEPVRDEFVAAFSTSAS